MAEQNDDLYFKLEVDDQRLRSLTDDPVVMDETVRVLARESRLGLSVIEEKNGREGERWAKYLKLRCVGQAAPKCRLSYLKVAIKFNEPRGTLVADMRPEQVKSEQPVKITTSYSGGLGLEALKVKLGPEAKLESAKETSHYFSEVEGTGKGFGFADWIFRVPAGQELFVNRDLHLVISYPGEADTPVLGKVTLRAEVRVAGVLGFVPLIGKRTKEFKVEQSW